MGDHDQEMARLEEYHKDLSAKDAAALAGGLRNGYLPDDFGALIEAGVRCIPLIEDERSEVVNAAIDRLQAVIFKLKLNAETPEVRRALERFQQVIDQQKKQGNKDALYGFLVIGGLLVILGGIAVVIVKFVAK